MEIKNPFKEMALGCNKDSSSEEKKVAITKKELDIARAEETIARNKKEIEEIKKL